MRSGLVPTMVSARLSFLHNISLFVSDVDGQMVLVLVDNQIQQVSVGL